ncbi:LOW QUALITY PROTEIN: guanine nucleotide exchange factor DBS-like [Uloborus diversus]|uniref:LOW QUALITY PROTEIN: guanine nucleotide exchange factor DBS-like n=1 Tax=Uloborus diversus TaxID=327109 RepID=UPI00240A12EF|nr:LOW QUALITY PROTEIN: guanine nucleotide exchange factor DBS-like [Uloborus diversus]
MPLRNSHSQIEEQIDSFIQTFKRNSASFASNFSIEAYGASLRHTFSAGQLSPTQFRGKRSSLVSTCSSTSRRTSTDHSVSEEDVSESSDETMEENSYSLCVQDVAYLLQNRYAIITGGKTLDGFPIITFPDSSVEFLSLSEDEYRRLVLYLTSVPSMQDADRGFVLVIDRRNDKWSAVKTVLLKIAGFFPALIQVVFVLRPAGFLQKAISGVSNKFFKEEFKFKVVVCSTIEELHCHIDISQLTSDLGGTISYDHNEWIQQRTAVEKFSKNTSEVSVTLQAMITQWQASVLPNDPSSTSALIEEHGRDHHDLKEDIHSAIRHGETLLSCIRRPSEVDASLDLCPDKLINVAAVERLLIQLDETEKSFDAFWVGHEKKLQQCLELRYFEQDFREVQNVLSSCMDKLCAMPSSGDSLMQVQEVLKDVEDFEENVQVEIARMEDVQQRGKCLIEENHYAVDSISPKCMELEKMVGDFQNQLQHKLDILRKYCDLHDKIEKANTWCAEGVELLASHQIEKCTCYEFASRALQNVDEFLQKGREMQICEELENHSIFEAAISPETRTLVQQVLKRLEDMRTVCEKRKSSLEKLAVKPVRPVQAVVPEPKHPPLRRASPDNEKKVVLRRGTKTTIEICHEENEIENSAYFRPIQTSENSHSNRNSTDILKLKRGHVMAELIETEKTYVTELKSILNGYMKEIENPALRDLVPAVLFDEKETLFGNMEDIYAFHSNIFLTDLEGCSSTPELVGKCFVLRSESFHKLYSIYCLNKPKSESLRRQCGDDNPFFKECQRNLGHKLPLGAYLLKPVQRITKYQLLLQDLLKFCEESIVELKEALDTMLTVLKYVNDSMHQVAITGFHGCLTEYGRLLLQSSFNVWVENKKDRIRELRFKPHQRHIFLYEGLVLFTKKYGREESPSYAFKNALKTSQIGLTENMHGSKAEGRKFELWLHGRKQIYILQAPTPEIKLKWVSEIKRVLFQQFEHLKDENKKLYSEKIKSLNGLISQSPVSKRGQVVSSQSWDNAPPENNNMVAQEKGRRATFTSEDSYQKEDLDNQDDGWSTDELSQTEDEDEDGDIFLQTAEVKGRYVVLGDYAAVDVGEASLHEGQVVEVEKVGCAGWWYVRCPDSGCKGWVPASYLGPSPHNNNKRNSRSSPSISSQDSGSGSLQRAASKSSVTSNMSSTSQEAANS